MSAPSACAGVGQGFDRRNTPSEFDEFPLDSEKSNSQTMRVKNQ